MYRLLWLLRLRVLLRVQLLRLFRVLLVLGVRKRLRHRLPERLQVLVFHSVLPHLRQYML